MYGVTIVLVVFAPVFAAVCALLMLRSLGNLELPESPPFPRRGADPYPHRHA